MNSTSQKGYTITEVLIVVAVSGVMFANATLLFRGRQQQVQFTQSVKDFENVVTDIMNDVSTGYYPTNTNVSCTVTPVEALRPIIGNTTNSGLGRSNQCVYVGKALQFVPGGVANNQSAVNVYSLAGKRYLSSSSTVPAGSISEIKPVAVADPIPPTDIDFPDTIDKFYINYGVQVTRVVDNDGAIINYGTIVFLSNYDGANVTSTNSSGQNVKVAGIRTTALNQTQDIAVGIINSINDDSAEPPGYININPDSGIIICLSDGGTQKASITIGGKGGERTVLRIGDIETECS